MEAIDLLTECAAGKVHDPHAALEDFHARWEARGVWWTRPRPMAFDFDDWISAADMAVLADVAPNTVHQWRHRGYITSQTAPDGSPLYNVGEVMRHQALQERAEPR